MGYNKMNKLGLALAVMSVFGLIGLAGAQGGSAPVTAEASITALTCGLNVNGGPLEFGTVIPNSLQSPLQPLYVTDAGNINEQIFVTGTDWFNPGPADIGSSVGWTQWGAAYNAYPGSAGTALTGSDAPVGALAPYGGSSVNPVDPITIADPTTQQTIGFDFGLTVPTGASATGYMTQTITISSSC